MKYLESFRFPSVQEEYAFLEGSDDFRVKYHRGSFYPFKILSNIDITSVILWNITIFYGGNGCGKTTALNVIAEKMHLKRETLFNSSKFFPEYLEMCSYEVPQNRQSSDSRSRQFRGMEKAELPRGSRIITSDDVFEHCMSQRRFNSDIDRQRADAEERYNAVIGETGLNPLQDYERYKERAEALKSRSKYIRKRVCEEAEERSNGESAMVYFTERMEEDGLYLLDEPENSLSFENQTELAGYVEECAARYGYQFIIATHSPVFLAMKDAVIYDFDTVPVKTRDWTELGGVRAMYDFFRSHRDEFE